MSKRSERAARGPKPWTVEGASGAPYATERSARSERDERLERASKAAGAREQSGRSEGERRLEGPKRRSAAAGARGGALLLLFERPGALLRFFAALLRFPEVSWALLASCGY